MTKCRQRKHGSVTLAHVYGRTDLRHSDPDTAEAMSHPQPMVTGTHLPIAIWHLGGLVMAQLQLTQSHLNAETPSLGVAKKYAPDLVGATPHSPAGARDLFDWALAALGYDGVAQELALHPNTVKRWSDQGRVPIDYFHELRRILVGDITVRDGAGREPVSGIDQFYTKFEVASHCFRKFQDQASALDIDLSAYTYVEPSAGSGNFFSLMPRDRRIGIDIAPASSEIELADFLSWQPPAGRAPFVVLGNPPFGLRGHLALKFINHAAKFSDLVGFILPQLFDSDGKGVPAKRVRGLSLVHSEQLPPDSFEGPDGRPTPIHTVFQVWTGTDQCQVARQPAVTCQDWARVYSLSDGGTSASTRNRAMLYACDVYLPSTCYAGMKAYDNFDNLPHRRGYGVRVLQQRDILVDLLMTYDWATKAFKSTNSALNLRTGLIESVIVELGYADKLRTVCQPELT